MNYVTEISKENSNGKISVAALSRLNDLVKSVWFIGNKLLSLKAYEGYLKDSGARVVRIVIGSCKLPKWMILHIKQNSIFRNNYRLII